MSEQQSSVKINKTHGGKEFSNFFKLVGKVEKHQKWIKESSSWDTKEFFEEKPTQSSGKPRRSLVLDLLSDKYNRLKIELAGMEQQFAYPYSSANKHASKVEWKDRHDKTTYPDDTYHLIEPEWDKVKTLSDQLETLMAEKNGEVWVEITGKYEFDEYEGKPTVKRFVNTITPIEYNHKIKHKGQEIDYVCGFDDPNFREFNFFNMQIGIRSTYQEENKNTKVNASFLTYGKERSNPKDVELMVYYKEAEEGKRSLADIFAGLNRLDFVEVEGVDSNRAEFTMVPVEVKSDDPFADADATTTKMKQATTGTRRGLEVTSVVLGTYIKEMLTEEELVKMGVTDRTQQKNNYDPFADDGRPIDISLDDLPF